MLIFWAISYFKQQKQNRTFKRRICITLLSSNISAGKWHPGFMCSGRDVQCQSCLGTELSKWFLYQWSRWIVCWWMSQILLREVPVLINTVTVNTSFWHGPELIVLENRWVVWLVLWSDAVNSYGKKQHNMLHNY